SGKTILIVGGLAAVGGGVALAAGGGGGGGATATPTTTLPPAQARSSQTFGGTLADQEQRGFVVTASRAGTLDAMLTWQDRSIALGIGCQLEAPPYTGCGTSNRTADTTAALSSSVTQTSYLILVSNYTGRAGTEAFTLTVLYPRGRPRELFVLPGGERTRRPRLRPLRHRAAHDADPVHRHGGPPARRPLRFPLRDPGTARAGRHGHGVQGARPQPGRGGRHQDPAPGLRAGPAHGRPLQVRDPARPPRAPPERLRDPRLRRGPGPLLHLDGIPGRRRPQAPAPRAGRPP